MVKMTCEENLNSLHVYWILLSFKMLHHDVWICEFKWNNDDNIKRENAKNFRMFWKHEGMHFILSLEDDEDDDFFLYSYSFIPHSIVENWRRRFLETEKTFLAHDEKQFKLRSLSSSFSFF